MSRVAAQVSSVREDGAYLRVALAARELFAPRPGQRVALAVAAPEDGAVPEVAWPCGLARPEGGPGALEVLLDGGERCTPHVGDRVVLTGPLGRGFRLPSTPCRTLLVGEGRTLGALLWLAAALHERGCRAQVLLVAETVDDVPGLEDARRCADDLVLATRDGLTSGGSAVEPDVVLGELLGGRVPPLAYVSGPPARAAAWAQACEAAGATTQVALDEDLPCGVGLCDGCRIPVLGRDGLPVPARLCAEGPVLPASRVAWDMLGDRW